MIEINRESRPAPVYPSPSGLFDFYYPYSTSVSIKDIYNNIYIENVDNWCESRGESWDECDVAFGLSSGELHNLPMIEYNDIIYTKMKTGYLKAATASASWSFYTDGNGNESMFGNAFYEGLDTDICGETDGSCIVNGFIGTIAFALTDNPTCDTNPATGCYGSCVNGIGLDPFYDDGGRVCECGLRFTLNDCAQPFGYLKWKNPDFVDNE